MMDLDELTSIARRYREELLENILPFWLRHTRDEECGGYLHCLDADGSTFSTEKCLWVIARAVWMFSRAFNDIRPDPAWLDYAAHGYRFILEHGFDEDGRMFYLVTRDGRPVRKRRYLHTECFGSIALSEHGRASGNREAADLARELFSRVLDLYENPDASMPPKYHPARRLKSLSRPMGLLSTAQVLRRNEPDPDPLYDRVISACTKEILSLFLHHEKKALFENVSPAEGLRLDIPAGRLVNPGHALETAWFLLEEARFRNDRDLLAATLPIVNYAMEIGWDERFGGITYFVDIAGLPPEQYEHDMKLWWVQLEALYANLLAWRLTGEKRYLEWFRKIDRYCFEYFPDRTQGEWFGYLHRDGTLASTVKGSNWKAPFHLPRALLNAWRLVEEASDSENAAPGHRWCGPPAA